MPGSVSKPIQHGRSENNPKTIRKSTATEQKSDEDLTDIIIPINDGNGDAVEVDSGATEVVEAVGDGVSETGESDGSDEIATKSNDDSGEEVVVETQVVVDPIQDLDEIVPDSVWTEYMIKPGQTLSLIAYEEYGNPNEWRTIYGWNKEKIGNDPNMIHPYHYLDLLKPSENSLEFEPDYYIHRVTRGETLWTISKKEYGDKYAWVVLYWDNEVLLQENDGVLKPGMELKVRTELWPEF